MIKVFYIRSLNWRSFKYILLFICYIVFFSSTNAETERADIIVAKDGTGNFASIQSALDSIPDNTSRTWIILVRSGIYNEKLYITKNNVAIVGENRDSVLIVYPELRRNWRQTHENDWGSAVVNIGNNVHDFMLANLTIYNNYGTLYGDHDHQFAIRGGGNCTRIITVNCKIMADGGDTMSLWNASSGMYYHANCFFTGWVDFVCPRGWCYITDCRFYGYNLTASIWHDGSSDSTSKLVIRNSYFDGVKNFPLGRHHKDAQFYLLDCTFSENMADRPIKPAFDTLKFRWGERYYYYNCHREGEDFDWYADNLTSAYGSPVNESEVTAYWTFEGKWDPERNMPAVLPFASIPTPRNNSKNITPHAIDTLRWIGGRNALSYNVYFGNVNPPPFVSNEKQTKYQVNKVTPDTHYYWRIDVVTDSDTLKGDIWEFFTGA